MKLNNAVVLLTGASQGIGRALALQLDQQGCRLLLVGRNAAALESVAAKCSGDGRGHGAGITTRRAVIVPWSSRALLVLNRFFPTLVANMMMRE